jgi:hypothetical protein
MNKLNYFEKHLIENGGYSPVIAHHCSEDEQQRMKLRGLLIYIPTLLAFLGMFLMVHYKSNEYQYSTIAAVLWAMVIFHVDKAMMQSTSSNVISLFGRIVFAIVNSIVIGECILLLVFSDTIDQKAQSIKQMEIDKIENIYTEKQDEIYKKLSNAKKALDKSYDNYIKEIDGSGGSGERGIGLIAQEKYEGYSNELKKYSLDTSHLYIKLRDQEKTKKNEIEAYVRSIANDLPGRLDTLHSVNSNYIHLGAWLLRILLLLVELLPILLKFGSSKASDIYDKLLQEQGKHKFGQIEAASQNEMEILSEKRKYIKSTAKLKANYENDIEELNLHNNYINELLAIYQNDLLQDEYKIKEINNTALNKNVIIAAKIKAKKWLEIMKKY